MTDTLLPCEYERLANESHYSGLLELARGERCGHLLIVPPSGEYRPAFEVLLNIGLQCGKDITGQTGSCLKTPKREIWVAVIPAPATGRRHFVRPIPISCTLKSLHTGKLRFVDEKNDKLVDSIELCDLWALPAFGNSGKARGLPDDDYRIPIEVVPTSRWEYAKVLVEIKTWANDSKRGPCKYMRAVATVAISPAGVGSVQVGGQEDSIKIDVMRSAGDVISALQDLGHIHLSLYNVVGSYYRYEGDAKSRLRGACGQINIALTKKTMFRENYAFWAAPGSGKTYLITELAKSLGGQIHFQEVKIPKLSSETEIDALERSIIDCNRPVLCLLDEIDAVPRETWVYRKSFLLLDLNAKLSHPVVFAMVGSGSGGLDAMLGAMTFPERGADLVSRIPLDRRIIIPPASLRDRAVIAVSKVLGVGATLNREIVSIEKLAIYYILVMGFLPRQIDDLMNDAVPRLLPGEKVLRYNHLFPPMAQENLTFYANHREWADSLGQDIIEIRL